MFSEIKLDEIGTFIHEPVSAHMTRIIDCLGIATYLVEGTQRACLLDTGAGLGNIRQYAENLTDLPITVAVSHGHLDHIGGMGFFDTVLMAQEELAIAQPESDREFRAEFFRNSEWFEATADDYAPVSFDNVVLAHDGDVLDLGDVSVTFVQVPGHTPGIFTFYVEQDRALILGDVCDDNVLLFAEYSLNVSGYLAGLDKLTQYIERSDLLLGNHGFFSYTAQFVENVRESCRMILAGRDAHTPVRVFGIDMFSAWPLDERLNRLDGEQGNVLYIPEKVG